MTGQTNAPNSSHVAIVTGANHGIGAAAARALAARGDAVVLTYLRLNDTPDPAVPGTYAQHRAQSADGLARDIATAGGRACAIEADLADPATPPRIFDEAERAFGPVDILVNNASSWRQDTFKPARTNRLGRALRAVTAGSFDAQFAVDARASALLIAEFARRHTERGASWGRIVSMTSGGPLGFPEEASYGAAKAALENYTMTAAFELAPFGITANVVHPPVTDTGWITDEVREFVASSPEHFHVALPEHVAEVIAYLASEAASLITANTIRLR